MTTLQDRVTAYKDGAKTPARKKKEWVPPAVDDFSEGYVLAFDQTFSKTGWARVFVQQGYITVGDKGILKEPPLPDLKGSADVLQRAEWMCERISHVVFEMTSQWGNGFTIVHEMPAAHGYRVEASLLGALGVRQAATRHGVKVAMVSNQHMRSILTPPGSDASSKTPIKLALERYGLLDGIKTNADERDAMALALTYLYDKKQAS